MNDQARVENCTWFVKTTKRVHAVHCTVLEILIDAITAE